MHATGLRHLRAGAPSDGSELCARTVKLSNRYKVGPKQVGRVLNVLILSRYCALDKCVDARKIPSYSGLSRKLIPHRSFKVTRLHTPISTRLSWLAPLLFCSLAFSQNGALRVTEPAPSKDGTIVTSEPAIDLQGNSALDGQGQACIVGEQSRLQRSSERSVWRMTGRPFFGTPRRRFPLRLGVNHVRIKALGEAGAATSVNIYYAPKSPLPASVLKDDNLSWKTDYLRGARWVRDLSERYHSRQGCRRGCGRGCWPRDRRQERQGTSL